VASMSATMRQELQNCQKRPDANPTITQLLQNKADGFDQLSNDAMNKQAQLESQQIQGTASAQAEASAKKVVADNTGAAGQSAVDLAAQKSAAEARAKQGTDQKTVYALNPQSGGIEQTTAAAAAQNGWQISNPKPNLDKDRDAITTMNDVQVNLSRYKAALQRLPAGQEAAVAGLINQGGLELGAHGFGASISLPTDWFNKLTGSAAWKMSSPEAQDAAIGYLRAKGAVPAFVKAITNSGRANKETMDIEMANMPDPTMPKDAALKQLDAIQENVAQRGATLPKLIGIPSPSDVKAATEQEEAKKSAPQATRIHGVFNPQTRQIDPFAGLNTQAFVNGVNR
jgi:hypothetical protein